MVAVADWFFDYVSPYPYLQMARFADLPEGVVIRPRPVLFAGLLNHWGHLGPAEIPAKRRQTYLYTRWLAEERGLPFAGPPRHPFNPLALLRLTVAAGATLEAVATVYAHVWGEGNDGQDPDSIVAVAAKLGIADPDRVLADPAIKQAVRDNTDEAIALGVYGVPTLALEGELFWGDDATPMFAAWCQDRDLFRRPPYGRLGEIPPAAERRGRRKT